MDIGIIGAAGGMGKSYAARLASEGNTLFVSDVNESALANAFSRNQNVRIMHSNREVAAKSDLLVYSTTPLNCIDSVIGESIGSAKTGAIVGGFTSVKSREVDALKRYARPDLRLVSMHPMHGPTLDPFGQTFIFIPVCSDDATNHRLEQLLRPLGPKIVYLSSASEHDKITADTQVLTHFSLFSMAEAWRRLGILPDEHPTYTNLLDDLKSLMAQRMLSQNISVSTGIAVENPEAKRQIKEYVSSVEHLVRVSIRARGSEPHRNSLKVPGYTVARDVLGPEKIRDAEERLEYLFGAKLDFEDHANSHLSLLAKGWTWMTLGIDPSRNIAFKSPPYEVMSLLTYAAFGRGYERFVDNMVNNPETQEHDFVFANSVASLGEDLLRGDEPTYARHLEAARSHFPEERLVAARERTDEIISRLARI